MLPTFFNITIASVAIFLGLMWYRKEELILGQWWEYSPVWLEDTVVLTYYYLGIYSMINSSRIVFDNRGMKPNKDDLDLVRTEDIHVNHVPVRVYRPASLDKVTKAPAVIYLTGGGFVYSSKKSHNGFCYRLARTAGVVVFLLEYRKAPEYIFPAAFNDCYEASIYLVNNAENFTIDATRVVIMGDSAGGNLAAAVAEQVASLKRKCTHFAFAAQVLIYPTLQFLDFSLPSFEKYAFDKSLSKEFLAELWSLYINGTADLTEMFLAGNHSHHLRGTRYQGYLQPVESDIKLPGIPSATVPEHVRKALTDTRACPLLADDLRENPPTLIITAEHDVVRDDGTLYGVRLKRAGVKVTHNSYSAPHGFLFDDFDSYFAAVEGRQAFDDIVFYLKDVFKQDTSDSI